MPTDLASTNSILIDLKHFIEGEVSSTAEDLLAVSTDFGGMIQKQPQVVVRPQNAADVAKAVKYAAAHGLTISPKAAGHSCSGQSLNQDGILLDMRSLNQIHEFHKDELWFKVDSGTTWRKIVDAALPEGVVPPVLTNNFDVTIGGTHAAGGLGQNSFRYGCQANNCLGLEVVTADGEIIWCSPDENSELFYHVLCGYGQFGITTQIQHRLKPYRPFTCTYFLRYDDLGLLLNDERLLVSEQRADGLLTLFSPCVLGFSRASENGIKPIIQWFYRMQITVELDSTDDVDEEKLLADLSFARHVYTEDLTFTKFVQPIAEVPHPMGQANPWLDVFLPASVAQQFIETALERIPSFIDFRSTPVGGFCLASNTINLPMFPMPTEEFVVGFGMYPTIPTSRLPLVADQLNQLTELAFEMGAKRYMGSWLELDLPGWRHQFGDYWATINAMKQKYDPQGILSPGFFPYEKAALPKQSIQVSEHEIAKFPVTVT